MARIATLITSIEPAGFITDINADQLEDYDAITAQGAENQLYQRIAWAIAAALPDGLLVREDTTADDTHGRYEVLAAHDAPLPEIEWLWYPEQVAERVDIAAMVREAIRDAVRVRDAGV